MENILWDVENIEILSVLERHMTHNGVLEAYLKAVKTGWRVQSMVLRGSPEEENTFKTIKAKEIQQNKKENLNNSNK